MLALFKVVGTLAHMVVSSAQVIDTLYDASFLMGKFEPAEHPHFVKIPLAYTTKPEAYMHKEAFDAFVLMHEAAKGSGIQLTIVSAARNFDAQKKIWEDKWNGNRLVEGENLSKTMANTTQRALKIMRYSSMPGTSRHHWGTDVDFNALEDLYFSKGEGRKVYLWLLVNAPKFGFCQPYTAIDINRPNGYQEEKWHWTYVPLSARFTKNYAQWISYKDIVGFEGCETAEEVSAIQHYVLGIADACVP
jgi:D-alanyl-D-alanine carboxypeptidase